VVVLLAAAFLLTAIGLVMVLSASSVSAYRRYGSSFLFFKRQALYALGGAVVLLVTAHVRFEVWKRFSLPLLVVSATLLALALHPAIGVSSGGASRWIELGAVTVQPSELAKLAMVVFAASVLTRKWRRLDEPAHLLIPLAPVVGAEVGLIMLQRDLGTSVIITGAMLLLLFVSGVRFRYVLAGGVLCAAAGTALIVTEGYRKARVLAFLHPWDDPTNTGYQLIQSLIGLGSGGWLGVGLGASRQKWLYIPNAHTDFIFSILGEELGLLGELVVLALFGLLLWAGVRIAARTRDTFGRLLSAGIVSWLSLQIMVNLGAVTGLLPVTGVPLPFVSFGGSSLVVTLAAVGILVNVGRSAGRGTAPSRPERGARR
jgi:cell division protein FtsW